MRKLRLRVEDSHPEVLGAGQGQHVLQGLRHGSPGADLALLRGVGTQVQPSQVVHLGLAWCPGRQGEMEGVTGLHTHADTCTQGHTHACTHWH